MDDYLLFFAAVIINLPQRTIDKANAAIDKIETNIANDSDDAVEANTLLKSLKLTPMACDLADLSSIDAFVKNLDGQQPFDAVCYNAGLARNTGASDVARTKEGFELTVGTNHLVRRVELVELYTFYWDHISWLIFHKLRVVGIGTFLSTPKIAAIN